MRNLQTSRYRQYLQSRTFATAGCSGEDKPMMLMCQVTVWPVMESLFFIVICLLTEKKSDVAVMQACRCVYEQHLPPRYSTSLWFLTKVKRAKVFPWVDEMNRRAPSCFQEGKADFTLISFPFLKITYKSPSFRRSYYIKGSYSSDCALRLLFRNCHKKISTKRKKEKKNHKVKATLRHNAQPQAKKKKSFTNPIRTNLLSTPL